MTVETVPASLQNDPCTLVYLMFKKRLPFQVVKTENLVQIVRTSVIVRMEQHVTLGRGHVSVPWGT
jgi:hypothetical protein